MNDGTIFRTLFREARLALDDVVMQFNRYNNAAKNYQNALQEYRRIQRENLARLEAEALKAEALESESQETGGDVDDN